MKNSLKNKQGGFTLIELSIVIVIIGILVGGVVLGGKVIDRARLAKFATELSDAHRAVILFQDTYNALPGDYNGVGGNQGCTNATSVDWSTWPNICLGNGDGKIVNFTPSPNPSSTQGLGYEYVYGRNHLVYEGFLNDSFSKRLDSSSQEYNKFPKSYSKLRWILNFSAGNTNSNVTTGANTIEVSGVLDGNLAYKIDKKVDDGYPKTGILGNTSGTACLTGANYNTSAADCDLSYKLE